MTLVTYIPVSAPYSTRCSSQCLAKWIAVCDKIRRGLTLDLQWAHSKPVSGVFNAAENVRVRLVQVLFGGKVVSSFRSSSRDRGLSFLKCVFLRNT